MSDDIVAAHLAAALIQAGSQKLDAKTVATIYFDCLEAVRAERQKRYEPPKGGPAGIDGPGGIKHSRATPLGTRAAGAVPHWGIHYPSAPDGRVNAKARTARSYSAMPAGR
jgi:hypothetical protein